MKLYNDLNFNGNAGLLSTYSRHLGGKVVMMLMHEQGRIRIEFHLTGSKQSSKPA